MGSLLHTAARLELSATQALIRPLNHASGIDDSPPRYSKVSSSSCKGQIDGPRTSTWVYG